MSAEIREPLGPSMAYTMGVGVGRGRSSNDGSVMSYSSTPVYAGRGAMLLAGGADANRQKTDMANAQRPYEQYLVIVYCFAYSEASFQIYTNLKLVNFFEFVVYVKYKL